ncbi:MAG TPA: agmatinase [Candidatus Hypogeohydataceae bacterium YC40]
MILPIPYDSTCTHKTGAREGPRAIIHASRNLEFLDDELLIDATLQGIHTLPEIMPDSQSPERMVEKVYQVAKGVMEQGKFLVSLGGEHTVTIGLVKAHKERYPGLSVLQIDAHMDLRDSYAGSQYNHACVMRRIQELCEITQVGIRSYCQEELNFAREKGFEPFYKRLIDHWGDWPEEVIERLSNEVYVTIDLDGLDPSIVPSVGTPEPGGLGWREVLRLLRRVAEKKRIVGFDIMELSPDPNNIAPDYVAARLAYKTLGYALYYSHG